MGIQLLADNKLIALPDSLEQAKKLAEPYIIEKREIKIECSASPSTNAKLDLRLQGAGLG